MAGARCMAKFSAMSNSLTTLAQHLPLWSAAFLAVILGFGLGWLSATTIRKRAYRDSGDKTRDALPLPTSLPGDDEPPPDRVERPRGRAPLPSYGVLAHLLDGAVVIDRQQRIAFINDAALDLLDLSVQGAIVGARFRDLVRNLELDRLLRECQQTGRVASARLDWHKRSKRRLLAQAIPMDPIDRSVLLVIRDTTELHRLEQVRRDFVANVSHELKTPLAAIVAIVDTLLELPQIDREATQRFLSDLRRQAGRLHRLVLDLLRLSELESEEAPLEQLKLDVAAIASSVCDELRPLAEDKRLTLRLQLDPAVATGDAEGVREIIENLVDNAIKYTPSGGTIDVRVRADERAAVIEVADTGIGISRQDQQRIFERFYRVDRDRSRAGGGTGLGLAIVKHLVQRMGGWIELQSELGRGSTFRVFLPRAAFPTEGESASEGGSGRS